jgi:hypothetical protein
MSLEADLDVYRDDFTTRHAEQLRAHQDRVRQLEDDQRAWLTRFIDGDADEGSHTDVGQGHGASATGPAPAPEPGPGQPNHAAEMVEAMAIKQMSMAEYAALRAEFGIRSPTDMNRLSGETR